MERSRDWMNQPLQQKSKAGPKVTPSVEVHRQIIEAVARHLGRRQYRLYLFGSRAQGRATSRSDYDLGLLAEGPIELGVLARIQADLEELPILQTIDLVDLRTASPERVQSVLSKGKLLDER